MPLLFGKPLHCLGTWVDGEHHTVRQPRCPRLSVPLKRHKTVLTQPLAGC